MRGSLLAWSNSKHIKFTSLFVTLLFTASLVQLPKSAFASPSPAISLATQITVPQDFGTIHEKRIFQRKNTPLILHIQNAHANYEAQKNISHLLKTLQDQYGITNVFVEGAIGKTDVSLFRAIPKKDLLKNVINSYMKEAKLNGAEGYAITAQGTHSSFWC